MEKQVVDTPQASDRVTIDVLAILNRRRGWLVLSCILGVAVGAAYFLLTPKRFESRAELLLMQNETDPSASTYGSDRHVSEELLATHMKLVQSPRIAIAALKETPAAAAELVKMDQVKKPDDTQGETGSDEETVTSGSAGRIRAVEAPRGNGEAIAGLSPAEAIENKSVAQKPSENKATPSVDGNGSIASLPAVDSSEAIPGLAPDQKEYQATESATTTSEYADYAPGEYLAVLPSILSRYTDMDHPIRTKTADGEKVVAEIDSRITGYVLGNLSVTSGGSGRARNAHVLNIAFRHTNPREAELITRAVVHHYREFVKTKFKDINTEAAGLIQKAESTLQKSITDHDKKYKEWREGAPMLSRGASGTDIHTARYEELQLELSQLQIKRDEVSGRLDLVTKSLKDLNSSNAHNLEKLSLIDQQNAERLGVLVTVERGKAETAAFQSTQPERMAGATAEYGQLLTMKTRLSQLTADFGAEYPEVKSLKQQISEMENILGKKSKALSIGDDVQLTPDDVMRAYVSMLKNDLQALEQRAKDIAGQIVDVEVKARDLVQYQLEDESWIRERQRLEQLYDAVVQRLRDINNRVDQSPLILEIIKEPSSGDVVEPKRIIAFALSFVCALLIGGVGVLVAELRDRSVHSPEEFEEMLGSRVLSHLPNFQNDPEIRRVQRQSRKLKSPLSPTLLTYYAPDSRASEAFRALRTQVMFAAGGDHRILVTTSASQGAGKSMLSSNMAVSMASIGADVLLIDCDMRLPQVHRLFGVPNDTGLADAIANPDKVDEYLKSSSVSGLTLLTSGQSPANPAELLSRPECKELLEKLRSRFSYIILDCPPVLAVSDPSILAPYADGVLFVTMVDGESRPKTERSKRILEGVGSKILGIVVNRSDESAQRYGYQAYGYENNSEQGGYYAARPAR